jgi:hypothetical protein
MTYINSTQANKDTTLTKDLWLIILGVIPLLSGFASLYLGKDINWDLLNYHYYNAYAFLNHRMDFDIAPAQLQTFINPIADIPFYWMIKSFPAWVSGFVIGFIHGLNLSLVFMIFWKLSKNINLRQKILAGLCLVIVSGIAPGFISELGNTMHDNLTSVFVLGAVYLLLSALDKVNDDHPKVSWRYIGAAGLIMGIGVGIKPSIVIFALSSALIFTLLQPLWRNKLTSLFIYGATGMTGGLLSAGFWWWEMWQRFRNPFFPFYNHIFKSPYFTATEVNWSTFLPEHLWEYFIWPLIFTFNGSRVNQFNFFDIRFALLYILFLVWIVVFLTGKIRTPSYENNRTFNLNLGTSLLLFFILSYILWIRESATYRFLIPLELLTPLCFLILLDRLIPSHKTQTILAVSAAVLTVLLFKPFNWGRLEWSDSYFTVDLTNFDISRDTLVVMLGRSPMSYVIPEFPPYFRFIRPESNLFTFLSSDGKVKSRDDQQIFIVTIKDLLEQQSGSFYILYNKEEPNIKTTESLLRLGITPNIEECFLLKVNTPDKLEICRVSR